MNNVLKQYIDQVDGIDHESDIDDMIDFGDWMLLTTNRQELQESNLTDEEAFALADTDQTLSEILTEAQLEQLAKQEPELPIKKWWG